MDFRRASESDIPLLRQLAERIWRDYYPAIIGEAQVEYMLPRMYAEDVIHKEIADGVVWEIGSENDVPIAFCSVGPENSERAKLHKLYLDPASHGRGLGRLMIERAIQIAQELGATELCLQVNKQNARAIRAYERAGFNVEREAVVDIGGGFVMDDYVMVRGV